MRELQVRCIIVAGEAGGSLPAVRQRIEQGWQARVIDHSGATEIGPWGFGWPDRPGLHVIETGFVPELIPHTAAGPHGELKELVLTTLGRYGAPVLRYRTGDLIEVASEASSRCGFLWLPRGVVGRVDSMVTIRGVNVFPSSIDAIVRQHPSVGEYRVRITREGELDQLEVDLEAQAVEKPAVVKHFETALGLRIRVHCVPAGSLPRSEGKSLRWQDQR